MFDEKVSGSRRSSTTSRARPRPRTVALHELLMLASESIKEVGRLNGEVDKAWADGDQMAWRYYSGKAMASLVDDGGHPTRRGQVARAVDPVSTTATWRSRASPC